MFIKKTVTIAVSWVALVLSAMIASMCGDNTPTGTNGGTDIDTIPTDTGNGNNGCPPSTFDNPTYIRPNINRKTASFTENCNYCEYNVNQNNEPLVFAAFTLNDVNRLFDGYNSNLPPIYCGNKDGEVFLRTNPNRKFNTNYTVFGQHIRQAGPDTFHLVNKSAFGVGVGHGEPLEVVTFIEHGNPCVYFPKEQRHSDNPICVNAHGSNLPRLNNHLPIPDYTRPIGQEYDVIVEP